jgi:hypothetical protein
MESGMSKGTGTGTARELSKLSGCMFCTKSCQYNGKIAVSKERAGKTGRPFNCNTLMRSAKNLGLRW